MTDEPYRYETPIQDMQHLVFCLNEAQRRYGGKIILDDQGMYVVRDGAGLTHTDHVLREVSARRRQPDLSHRRRGAKAKPDRLTTGREGS
jgi:hypothetical protein